MVLMCQKAPSAKRCIKTDAQKKIIELLFAGQKAPSAKRCIKTTPRTMTRQPRRPPVRKHRAPKGALRPSRRDACASLEARRQKAPSAKRCIKTPKDTRKGLGFESQKAPSAKRCIKT